MQMVTTATSLRSSHRRCERFVQKQRAYSSFQVPLAPLLFCSFFLFLQRWRLFSGWGFFRRYTKGANSCREVSCMQNSRDGSAKKGDIGRCTLDSRPTRWCR
jgi:hypothetical protein